MVTLGACYGAQAVGSYRALQLVNPMPYKLVAIEPEPENYEWTRRHMRDNGIDPDNQWIIKAAISAHNDPSCFRSGRQALARKTAFATNDKTARKIYVDEIVASRDVQTRSCAI